MKIEDQVSGLEESKLLKDLGVVRDSLWYWFDDGGYILLMEDDFPSELDCEGEITSEADIVSAFTVAELGVMLPTNKTHTLKWFDEYYCEAWDDVVNKTDPIGRKTDKNEANARAKMLIHLLENKIITAEQVNERLGVGSDNSRNS